MVGLVGIVGSKIPTERLFTPTPIFRSSTLVCNGEDGQRFVVGQVDQVVRESTKGPPSARAAFITQTAYLRMLLEETDCLLKLIDEP